MIEVSRTSAVAPRHVFAVLADGWSYASWVVGKSHVREVDRNWPEIGARIHHSAGFWPMQLRDVSEVRAMEPDRLLELDARLWFLGTAVVRLELAGTADGGTEILMGEEIVEGPMSQIPIAVQGALLRPRNDESLARLDDLARGRARAEQNPGTR